MIDWVSSLMAIMLFVGHMTSSYPSCPEECHCYQDRDLVIANCTSIPPSSENIEVLNLSPRQRGQDLELKEGQFTGFKKLKFLNLSSCSIYSVHKKSFFGVKSLIEIDLSNNNIRSLDSAVFQHITNLTSVVLRGNNFFFDSDDPFLISNTIVQLDIGDCGISHLPLGVFYGAKRIKNLALDQNKLTSLKYNSLPKGLVYLNLSNNLIVNVPTDLLASLKHLRILDLSANPINCTCPLLNLQDHFSGMGVTFEHKVICASPPQYAGLSWSQVNENELCIEESLFEKQPNQQKYKYQINPKHESLEDEKKNDFEANFQADQPYDEIFKQDSDAEILFQNDDTRAMGVMMHQEDEKQLENLELKNSDFKNLESNQEGDPEDVDKHFNNNFPDKTVKKTFFDDVNDESGHKVDPINLNIVEAHTKEINNTESTTQKVETPEENIENDEEIDEQNDGANVEVESGNSDKIEETQEGLEALTEKNELKEGVENENMKISSSDVEDNDQVVSSVHVNITDVEGITEKAQSENKKEEMEVNIPSEHNKEKDSLEGVNIDTVSLDSNPDGKHDVEDSTETEKSVNNEEIKESIGDVTTQNNIIKDKTEEGSIGEKLEQLKVEGNSDDSDAAESKTEEPIDQITTEFSIKNDAEDVETVVGSKNIGEQLGQLKVESNNENAETIESNNEEPIEEITTNDNINKDAEVVVGVVFDKKTEDNSDKILGQLKVDVANEEVTTNENIETIEDVIQNETKKVLFPVNVEKGIIDLLSEQNSNKQQEDEFEEMKQEATETSQVDEVTVSAIEGDTKLNENKEVTNIPNSEVVATTEGNFAIEGIVKSENEQLEKQTEQTKLEAHQNIEETIEKKHSFNLENQLNLPLATTTDSEVSTTLESQTEKVDDVVQSVEENKNNPIDLVDQTESYTSINIETTTSVPVIVEQNEAVREGNNSVAISGNSTQEPILPFEHDVIDKTTDEPSATDKYPVTSTYIDVNQDNIPIDSETESFQIETSQDKAENTSAVLANINQDVDEPEEDDNLIGDKTLKETVPMEFEAAHAVLGCIVVLVAVLVLIAIYKCSTEGKKSSRSPKDVESNRGTEMQDMASLLPKPNNEEPKIVSKKYPDEAPTSETVSLIQKEKKDIPTETKSAQENENSLNNNTPLQTKPSLNRTATPLTINPSALIQRTRVKVGIIPESIPRTPIFVQKSYNNGVTNG